MTTPLLLIGDSPSSVSGLGRILRDLALRLHENCSDIFRVATLGYGGFGSKDLPWQQYYIESMENWFIPSLPDIWKDFAGDEKGAILTVWDASRLLWFARPEYCRSKQMRDWLEQKKAKKWGYFAIDAEGPHKGMSYLLQECMKGYDRVLAYSRWAAEMASMVEIPNVEFIPHGIDTSVFKRRPRAASRRVFHEAMKYVGPIIADSDLMIGIVATNQARKDFGLAIRILEKLSVAGYPVRVFIQTDTLERAWSIPNLLYDFNLMPNAIVNCVPVSDEVMSYVYSACDITLGIDAGEGFGYPIFESLACETPCVTGSYGGHAEWMDRRMLVKPEMLSLDGLYNSYRPVFSVWSWVERIKEVLREVETGRLRVKLPEALDWNNLWPDRWEPWFRQGHQSLHRQENSQDSTSSTPQKGSSRLVTDNGSTEAPAVPAETGADQVSVSPVPESV